MLTCIYSISRSLQQKRFYYVRLQSANKNSTDTQTSRLFLSQDLCRSCELLSLFLCEHVFSQTYHIVSIGPFLNIPEHPVAAVLLIFTDLYALLPVLYYLRLRIKIMLLGKLQDIMPAEGYMILPYNRYDPNTRCVYSPQADRGRSSNL